MNVKAAVFSRSSRGSSVATVNRSAIESARVNRVREPANIGRSASERLHHLGPHRHMRWSSRQALTSNSRTAPSGFHPAPLPPWVMRSTRTRIWSTFPGTGRMRAIEIAL
jgi:hypothetical protein